MSLRFTVEERDRRFEAVRSKMRTEGLDALVVFGSTSVGGQWNGNFTYLSNYSLIFATAILTFPLEGDPVLFVPGENQWLDARRSSWLEDIRLSGRAMADACQHLRRLPQAAASIGVSSLDALPAGAFAHLKEQFPEAAFAEATQALLSARRAKSAEEMEAARWGARVADAGWARGLEVIRAGMSERQLFAEMEMVMTSEGAGGYFDMLGAGRGEEAEDPFRGFVVPPAARMFREGDLALLEITPRVAGYWNQIVRLVSFGPPPASVQKAHYACIEAKHAALERMRPGEPLAGMSRAAQKALERHGYAMKDFGSIHTTGLDLSEQIIMTTTEGLIEPGMLITLHPMISIGDWRQLFVGETYAVTGNGHEMLNHCDEGVAVVER